LRYYDQIGLLKPAHIDRWTSYRYYSASLSTEERASLARIIRQDAKITPAMWQSATLTTGLQYARSRPISSDIT
jgi:hypothetical protein